MLKIRLTRIGKKHAPTYRIVVKPTRSKRDGDYIDLLGSYDPQAQPPAINIDKKKVQYWQEHGAQMTPAVEKLLKPAAKK